MKIIVLTGDTFSFFNENYYSVKPDVKFIQKVFGVENVTVIGPHVYNHIDYWNTEIQKEKFIPISIQPHFNTKVFLLSSIARPFRRLKLRLELDRIILSNIEGVFWVRTPSAMGLYFARRIMKYNGRLICHIAGDARDTWKDSKYGSFLRYFARMYSMVVIERLKEILKYERALVFCSGEKLLKFADNYGNNTSLLVDTIVEKSIEYVPETKKETRLLYVGRLVADKGIDLLIEAIAKINVCKGQLILLDIVGSGLDEKLLRARVKHLHLDEQVIFHGIRSGKQLISFYHQADILVVPTKTNEGLPRVIYEAWSHGVPVLVSDVGGMPYAVEHNVDGLIFERDNLASLLRALSTIQNSDVLRRLNLGALKRADTADFNYWKSVVHTQLHRLS